MLEWWGIVAGIVGTVVTVAGVVSGIVARPFKAINARFDDEKVERVRLAASVLEQQAKELSETRAEIAILRSRMMSRDEMTQLIEDSEARVKAVIRRVGA